MRSKIVVSLLVLGSIFCLSLANAFADDIDTEEIYAEKCALCHGDDGKGTDAGKGFGTKDFTDKEWQSSRTDDEFVNSITNGNPDNTNYLPFGDMLSEEEIKAMVPHVRAFAH
ncbi:cytochrome c, mono- and diheme variants [Candidatus Scalindua japonica]|uniref:Cytochrome c, mono-and diheme variants n=1 Tax=Candidatus Scalindua japonica TaxID=1284222 RepID=A0A286TUB7_9BACT|nr:c-type cytochrome [Candidatus Scalindua japonica]GAX59489.1 cytochrome c, mono- and diheme variants [Candidatus Scalindua japonica]